MVGDDDQLGRCAKLVVGVAEQARVDMPVRADQWQVPDLVIEGQGHSTISRVEVAIFRQV